KLQFWEVAEIAEYSAAIQAADALLVAEAQANEPAVADTTATIDDLESDLARQLADGGDSDSLSSQVSPLFSLLKANYGLVYDLRDTMAINRILAREDVQSVLPKDIRFLWGVKP